MDNTRPWVSFSVLLLTVLGVWVAASLLLTQQQEAANYPFQRIVQYSFDIKNNQAEAVSEVHFSTFAPVAKNATQRVVKIKTSHPYELKVDQYHNQMLHFSFARLAPFETKVVTVRVELEHSEVSNPYGDTQVKDFLHAERFIQSSDARIVKKAQSIVAATDKATVKAIFQFAANRIDYKGYIKPDLGALHALRTREGDCTEYSALVVAFSRALGVPSRMVAGYAYEGNATLRSRDFHNWAEVFFDGRWYIVDAQYKRFVQNQSHFIAMRVVTPVSNGQQGSSHQLVYASDEISVKMN